MNPITANKQQTTGGRYLPQNDTEAWMAFIVASGMAEYKPGISTKAMPDSEINAIMALCMRSSMLGGQYRHVHVFQPVVVLGMTLGAKTLIDGAKDRINPKERKALFTYCCKVILSGQVFSDKKKEMLNYVADALNIDTAFYNECIRVIWIMESKNDAYFAINH